MINAVQLFLDRIASPLGTILLVWEPEVLRALDFEDYEARLHRLLRLHYGEYSLNAAHAPASLRRAIDAYFEGDLAAVDRVPVQTRGTAFQRRVWAELRRIPAGQTITYGQLAGRVERPGASRAVGLANGANPIAIVVPCHRVIGANGRLTGYGGGLERKGWLLAHERSGIFGQSS